MVDLFDTAAIYHHESALAPGYQAVNLYLNAWQIQTVILAYARGEMTKDDARAWVDAANAHLTHIARARMRATQPKGTE